jgi:hypothetical protein
MSDVPQRNRDGLGARLAAELLHDVLNVRAHRQG